MNMILRLIKAEAIPSREVELSEYENTGPEGSAIVQGKAAMDYYWSNQITAIWGAAGEDRNLTMIHLPHPKDGCCSSNYIKPSMFFTIAANSKHPKEAAMFIDFFTNSLEANQILMAERGVPVSSIVREGLKPLLEKPQLEMFAYLSRVQEYNSPIRPPDPPGHADIRDNVYRPEFRDAVLLGQISPEEGAKLLREMATEILSKNK
jgi:multiple sugar transport system substrate-binding protein